MAPTLPLAFASEILTGPAENSSRIIGFFATPNKPIQLHPYDNATVIFRAGAR